MKRYILKNGHVVDPNSGLDEICDILVDGRKIEKISKDITDSKAEIIDVSGKHIFPGLIDIHVHLRTPGQEYKEDIASGCAAAAAGGFTSIACMPNTSPTIDSPEIVRYIKEKAKSEAKINVYPIGSITKGLAGKELSEMSMMLDEGAVSFSDDGKYVENTDVMKNALSYAKSLGVKLISHSEDSYLSDGGEMNEGYFSTILGLKGIPNQCESIAVIRELSLAEKYGDVHIAHISTRETVRAIKFAKKKGLDVSCETAPHYLWFTDADVQGYDTHFKMSPPLRSKADQKSLIRGLKDGTIDVIATDHAPHTEDEKNKEFKAAPFGVIGLETSLAATLTKLYHEEKMKLLDIIAKMTINPAKVIKVDKGYLTEGGDADIVVVDINSENVVDVDRFLSKAKNCPFKGIKLKGKVLYTIANGKIVYRNNR